MHLQYLFLPIILIAKTQASFVCPAPKTAVYCVAYDEATSTADLCEYGPSA